MFHAEELGDNFLLGGCAEFNESKVPRKIVGVTRTPSLYNLLFNHAIFVILCHCLAILEFQFPTKNGRKNMTFAIRPVQQTLESQDEMPPPTSPSSVTPRGASGGCFDALKNLSILVDSVRFFGYFATCHR